MFYRKAEHFNPEALHLHRLNVFSFQMVLGRKRWYIVGCYTTPENASTIETVIVSIDQKTRRADLLVAGDFNDNLAAPEGKTRYKEIALALTTVGL